MARSRVLAVVLAACAVALAGCSDDDDEDAAEPEVSVQGAVVSVVEEECDDTGASCAAAFAIGDRRFLYGCTAVRPERVLDEVLGEGELAGRQVEVRAIEGVDDEVAVAVAVPGGACDDDDEATSEWSFAFVDGVPTDQATEVACDAGLDVEGC